MGSETVDLDVILLKPNSGREETMNLCPLVSLELDNLAEGFVRYNITVASKLLFEGLQNTLGIKVLWKSLNSRQSLTTIALLNTDVDFFLV